MVTRLKRAGLGYLWSSEHVERLGNIPLRELVYRVRPLPDSLIPLGRSLTDLGASSPLSRFTEALTEVVG